MRPSYRWIVGFTTLLTVLSASSAFAEGSVKSQTSQINMAGVRCLIPLRFCSAPEEQSRTLILQSVQAEPLSRVATEARQQNPSESPVIQGFRIVPTDFERKDSLAFVPAKWISSEIDASTRLSPQKYIAIPIKFDFQQVPASGEYTGSLIVEHSAGDLVIPIIVRVKDSFHLALPFLMAGVLLAFALAAYQAEGFDRDEINVKVGQLRLQMQSDECETARLFQAKAESALVDAATYLDTKAWTEARKSLLDAQSAWNRWRKQHQAWVDLHEYIQQTFEVCIGSEIPSESVYGKDLRFEIDRITRAMADSETPQAFSDLLKPLKEKVQKFLDAKSRYERLNAMRDQMGSVGDEWRQSLIDLDDGLNRLSLNDEDGLKTWQDKATDLKQAMELALKNTALSSQSRDSGTFTQNSVRSVPNIKNQGEPKGSQWPYWRLQSFRLIGQGVVIALLCGIGFNQLYAANPTFGANPVADYTSLLAWGFTAEVTRDSVAKILQRFKLPAVGG
jgi:hypothetical protein